jgi:hypothetical protein
MKGSIHGRQCDEDESVGDKYIYTPVKVFIIARQTYVIGNGVSYAAHAKGCLTRVPRNRPNRPLNRFTAASNKTKTTQPGWPSG